MATIVHNTDSSIGNNYIQGNNNSNSNNKMSHEQQQRQLKQETYVYNNNQDQDLDDIYSYYKNQLIPAITASLPLLFTKLHTDVRHKLYDILTSIIHFLIPWTREDFKLHEVPHWLVSKQDNFTQYFLHILDTTVTTNTTSITPQQLKELQNTIISSITSTITDTTHQSSKIIHWFQYTLSLPFTTFTLPLIDSKLAVFIWKSCSGLLILIGIATIIPGKIHVWSGQIFRWPVLIITYFMILSELLIYIMVRLFIRITETIFSTTKHRKLRKSLMEAKSYAEWRTIAKELDTSMGRDTWQCTTDDDTSYKYNWAFIKELIQDLRQARKDDDAMLALVVLRQCTRKNVGGVMNEDLFSVTYTGEPKLIVKEFLDEVVLSLKWLTNKSRLYSYNNDDYINGSGAGSTNYGDGDTVNGDENKKHSDNIESISSKDPPIIVKQVDTNLIKNVEKMVAEVDKDDHNILHLIDHFIGPVTWAVNSIISSQKHNDQVKKKNDAKPILTSISPSPSQEEPKVTLVEQDNHISINGEDYQKQLEETPNTCTSSRSYQAHMQEREQVKTFLKRARAAYGRTSLCLSGGGMMGCYHFGTIKALLDEDILPHIISGTSAGSVVASMICTRTDEEIERDLKPEILVDKMKCFQKPWPDRLRQVWEKGCLFDKDEWLEMIKWFTCGDLTFEEAYKKTGRILCITVSATTNKAPPVLVNYITAPDVTIASAVIASAAVPGFIKPIRLMKKGHDGVVRTQGENKDESYWDGSIDQDIPANGLAEMFNCQFFLASQCNPHIVPFFHSSKGCVAQPSRWTRGMRQDKSWRGGFLLAALEMYLKSDMKAKFVFLNELEAAVSFTSTMMTQQQYGGTTTIVPHVSLSDFFVLFSDPTLSYLNKCFQLGSVAAYQHCSMMKHHYRVAHALDECLALLEGEDGSIRKPRRRLSQLASSMQSNIEERQREKGYSINASVLPQTNGHVDEDTDSSTEHDDECESGGFDGVNVMYNQNRIKETRQNL